MGRTVMSNNVQLTGITLFAYLVAHFKMTPDEAVEYFDDVIMALPEEERLPMATAFYVFWNTIARNYTLTERKDNG